MSCSSSLPRISEFYQGKSVAITGATGFLGKTLLEKILRECPDVKTVYALVRHTKHKTPQERLEEILRDSLFDVIRKQEASYSTGGSGSPTGGRKFLSKSSENLYHQSLLNNDSSSAQKKKDLRSFESKVVAVPVDIAQPGLGISDAALLEEMKENVSIVLHCAATVNFNEKLDISLATNVSSVLNLIDFARSLRKIDAFVHVSTAYAHCDRQHIEEKFYEPTVDPRALIAAVKTMNPEVMAAVTKALLGKRPNTYTLTKSLAESVIFNEAADLPIAVVRPSIVGAIAKSPVPGWVDNLNGPGGFYLASAHNILRAMPGDPSATVDMVPVDHCVSMIVAVSWKLGVLRPGKPMVFNCSSGKLRPLNLGWHNETILKHTHNSPILESSLRRAHVSMVSRRQYDYLYNPIFHLLPALVIDLSRRLVGKKPMMRRLYQKINNSVDAYVFFSSQAWDWDVDNSIQLQKDLREEDKEAFDLAFTGLDWSSYLQKYYEGCKRFVKSPSKGGMGGSLGAESLSSPPPKSPIARVPNADLLTSPSTTNLLTNSGSTDTLSLLAGKPTKSSVFPVAVFTSTILLLILAIILTFLHDMIFEGNGAGGVMNKTAAVNFVSSLLAASQPVVAEVVSNQV